MRPDVQPQADADARAYDIVRVHACVYTLTSASMHDMRWNKKYDYPTSSRATEDGIRRYVLGEAKLPSVTSILDATKSEEDKAALANWRERTGHKEARPHLFRSTGTPCSP